MNHPTEYKTGIEPVEIPLTKGYVALVDQSDVELVSNYKWCYNTGYAVSRIYTPGTKQIRVYMHRLIMSAVKGSVVDHIDHNGLNNRKINLRICSTSENIRNSRKMANCSSRFKGVSLIVANYGRQHYYLCSLKTPNKIYRKFFPATPDGEVKAALEYNKIASMVYGEYAHLNTI